MKRRPPPRSRLTATPSRTPGRAPPGWLVIIDEQPLRHEALAELHRARKRNEASRAQLHQHEQVDIPAFREWYHRTFPTELSAIRRLHEELLYKSAQVSRVDLMCDITGRSAQSVWREYQKAEARHQARADEPPEVAASRPPSDPMATDLASLFDRLFEEESQGPSFHAASERDAGAPGSEPETFPPEAEAQVPRAFSVARECYRRLVQHLHPDRGGAWTPEREQLWHEVQAAWNARDSDWLARLEADWDIAHETLTPDAPLGRIRRAIREVEAARRDIDGKLRGYRRDPEWRFTLTESKRSKLKMRIHEGIRNDLETLELHLRYVNDRLAGWDRRKRSPAKQKARDQ